MTDDLITRARKTGATLRNIGIGPDDTGIDASGQPIGETPEMDGSTEDGWTIMVGAGCTMAEVSYDGDSLGACSDDTAQAICEAGGLLLRLAADLAEARAEIAALRAALAAPGLA